MLVLDKQALSQLYLPHCQTGVPSRVTRNEMHLLILPLIPGKVGIIQAVSVVRHTVLTFPQHHHQCHHQMESLSLILHVLLQTFIIPLRLPLH
jgi:hypothetical protein